MIIRFKRTTLAIAFLGILLGLSYPLVAQDPDLAAANLKYSKALFGSNHLTAQVELEIQQDKSIRFEYDHYPDLEKIVTAEGEEYSRAKGQPWVRRADFWNASAPVKRQKANVLDTYVKIVNLPFDDLTTTSEAVDNQQGVAIWKFIGRKDLFVFDLYTYEKSSAKRIPNGAYPRYTFIKHGNDKDGCLLLTDLAGPMADGVNVIPLIINYQLLFLPPSSRLADRQSPHHELHFIPLSGQ